jgi:hypothetical protein
MTKKGTATRNFQGIEKRYISPRQPLSKNEVLGEDSAFFSPTMPGSLKTF